MTSLIGDNQRCVAHRAGASSSAGWSLDLHIPGDAHLVRSWKPLREAVNRYRKAHERSGVYVLLWPNDNNLGPKGVDIPSELDEPIRFHCGLPYIMHVDRLECPKDARGYPTVNRLVGKIRIPDGRCGEDHIKDYVPEIEIHASGFVPLVTYAVRKELTKDREDCMRSVNIWDNARMYAFDVYYKEDDDALERIGEMVRRIHQVYRESTIFSPILLAITNLRKQSNSSFDRFKLGIVLREYNKESEYLSDKLRIQSSGFH
jgi:hypothetical protein